METIQSNKPNNNNKDKKLAIAYFELIIIASLKII